MAPTSSTESSPSDTHAALGAKERRRLLGVAAASIAHGLETGRPLAVDPVEHPPALRAPGATFVTLQLQGRLRGCIGSLEAHRPLVVDVAENAYAAAFRDPRFPPLSAAEFPELEIEISRLTPPEPLRISSEAELLQRLQPGVDGLIIEDGPHRATFLPAVWRSLPDPREFLAQLKLKAGLPVDHWSDTLRVYRYRTEAFSAPVSRIMAA